LKRDDPQEKNIRKELLKSDVISNDLIPLLKSLNAKKEPELFDIVLRILVNLTQSAYNCFEQKIPNDKIHFNTYLQIDNSLKHVKESFADELFARTISHKLNETVGKDWIDRPEEEDIWLERILYLVRNILLIKTCDDENQKRLDTDLNSHDLLLL
jgi:timeless